MARGGAEARGPGPEARGGRPGAGRGFRAGHPRELPALQAWAGAEGRRVPRGARLARARRGGAGHGQGTRRPHGAGRGRRGRRRQLAPCPAPPRWVRSPGGPAGGGTRPRCLGRAGRRARGSAGRASPLGTRRGGGGAGAGGACAGLGGRGPRALAAGSCGGSPGAEAARCSASLRGPASAAVGALEAAQRSRPGTSATAVPGCGPKGRPTRRGASGAPRPSLGTAGFGRHYLGGVSGVPRQSDPRGSAPGGCGPTGVTRAAWFAGRRAPLRSGPTWPRRATRRARRAQDRLRRATCLPRARPGLPEAARPEGRSVAPAEVRGSRPPPTTRGQLCARAFLASFSLKEGRCAPNVKVPFEEKSVVACPGFAGRPGTLRAARPPRPLPPLLKGREPPPFPGLLGKGCAGSG